MNALSSSSQSSLNSLLTEDLPSQVLKQTSSRTTKNNSQREKWYPIIIAEKIRKEDYLDPFTKKTTQKTKKLSKIIRNRHKISRKMVLMLKACLGVLFSYELYYNGKLQKRDGQKIQVRIFRRKLKADGYEIVISATKKAWLQVKELIKIAQQLKIEN
jgi:transcription-repair coupling factor (superfamily II helicase)